MKKLRVLHIYRTYFPETQGGAQEAIKQLCLATQPLGVENSIFTLARNPTPACLDRPEGRVVRARSWFEVASCDFGAWSALERCRAAADECDVIQVHYPWPFADFLMPAIRRRNQPVVVTYHSDIVRQNGVLGKLYAPLQRHFLSTAAAIVATSPNYEASSTTLHDYAKRVRMISLCLADDETDLSELKAYWKRRLGGQFFLFVGVLRYYKGLKFLIEAAVQTHLPIVIVGDGPERMNLEKQMRQLNLSKVHFLGALPDADKLALFSLCRAVVFPSHLRSEAFGITLLEGARAGRPLICCEIGTGTTWVNRHNETGLVVPPADAAALAQAMNRLAGDDALCSRLGQGARARWLQCFTPTVVGAAYHRLYCEVLAQAQLNFPAPD